MELFENKGQNGLPNVGNSCYLNSTIQCLAGTDELIKYFSQTATLPNGTIVKKYEMDLMTVKKIKNNKTKTKIELVKACYNLMAQLWSEKGQIKQVNPIPFYRLIGSVAKESKASLSISGGQQDFQEFLILLLGSLHDALSRETVMNIVGQDLNPMDKLSRQAYENFITNYEKDYSIFVKLFIGQINTLTIGECGHQSNIFDPINFFPLIVPNSPFQQPIRLDELFHNFVSPSQLSSVVSDNGQENDTRWHCETCKMKVNATTCNSIWDLPQYLIISLGRYQYFPSIKKINTPVIFPLENLDISNFYKGFKKHSMKYNLYAVSNHYGGQGGGHYTAFRKNPNNKWYSFNDSHVEEIKEPEKEIITNGAYCLFYKRQDTL
jgi:ubiquitin carboxyl-terminal hydrolase 2/21